VGPATAARLTARRLPVDLVPASASAADLARALAGAQDLAGARILWPRSDIARPELAATLRASGAVVIDPPAYRTIPMRPRALATFVRELEAGRIDAVAFLSPSSASGLASGLPGGTLDTLRGRTAVASIGPTTSAALVALGASPDVQAQERTSESLAAMIAQHLAARSRAPV
jgi:uroporphyrinogen-III synthase